VRPYLTEVPLALAADALERAILWVLRRARATRPKPMTQKARPPR
jgi:hypothetical protein